MKPRLTAAALATFACLATPLAAQPFDAKGDAGGWNIFFNQKTGGCFIERETDQGYVMQIGTEAGMLGEGPSDSYGFFALYVPGEAPEVDSDTPIAVIYIGSNTYIGNAHRVVREGYFGGYFIGSGDTDIATDLRKEKSMRILTANGTTVTVNLNQSNIRRALRAARRCQNQNS